MTEENKEKTEVPPAEKTEVPPTAVKKEEARPAAKREKPSNCAVCNKSIRKKRWYYRDGKFYCSKRCWHTTAKKKGEAEKAPQEEKK